jgi:hypothetical protein
MTNSSGLVSLTARPSHFAATRDSLHRVAAHVLGRARVHSADRSSLRVTIGGITTPTFGDDQRRIRIAEGRLLVETEGGPQATQRAMALHGSSLADLAALAGADLTRSIDIGDDIPPLGDVHARLDFDAEALASIVAWYEFFARLLDRVSAELPASAQPTPVRLWPEHFDVAIEAEVAVGSATAGQTRSRRVNLGGTPGDSFCEQPYLYVGPWGPERPGSDGYWNAPFGAVLTASDLTADAQPDEPAMDFLREGLRRLALHR